MVDLSVMEHLYPVQQPSEAELRWNLNIAVIVGVITTMTVAFLGELLGLEKGVGAWLWVTGAFVLGVSVVGARAGQPIFKLLSYVFGLVVFTGMVVGAIIFFALQGGVKGVGTALFVALGILAVFCLGMGTALQHSGR